MERAGYRPVPLRRVPAGRELTGRRHSAPLPAVRVADSCRGPRGRALRLPGDARQRAASHLGVRGVAAERRRDRGKRSGSRRRF